MVTSPNAPVIAAFRDADSVLRGPLPAEVSMEPIVSGASFAREDVLLDEADGFFAVWACDAGCALGLPSDWSGTWRVRIPLRTFDVFSTPGAR